MRGVWLMGFKVSSLTVCQPRLSSLTKLARRPMTHPCCLNFWHQRDQSGACHAPEKPTPARPFRAALGHPRRRAHLFWFWGASPPCFFTLKSRMRGGGGNSHGVGFLQSYFAWRWGASKTFHQRMQRDPERDTFSAASRAGQDATAPPRAMVCRRATALG